MLKNMVKKIKDTGANIVFCQKGIDDVAEYFLSENNITVLKWLKNLIWKSSLLAKS